jgi:hypothetical protein
MSVDKRRLAAAQRTAVGTSPSRSKRLRAWIVIVPALALFSFSVVAGAAGFGSKPQVATAAAKVIPPSSKGDDKSPKGDDKKDGVVVEVDSSKHDGNPLTELLGKAKGKEICWISTSQLARVSRVYRTTTSSLSVGGKTYSLVTVFNANEKTLRQLLGSSAVQCHLVQVAFLTFLPFDPNLS